MTTATTTTAAMNQNHREAFAKQQQAANSESFTRGPLVHPVDPGPPGPPGSSGSPGSLGSQGPPNLSHLIPRLTPRRRRREPSSTTAISGGGAAGGKPKSQLRAPQGLPADAPPTPALVLPDERLKCFASRTRRGVVGGEDGNSRSSSRSRSGASGDDDGNKKGGDVVENGNEDGNEHEHEHERERESVGGGDERRRVRHDFCIPTRHVLGPGDLERFRASPWHELIVGFVFGLADSVRGRPVSWVDGLIGGSRGKGMEENDDDDGVGDVDVGLVTVRAIERMLDAIEKLVEETPGEEEEGGVAAAGNGEKTRTEKKGVSSSSRFGKTAFRTFLKKLEGRVAEWHDDWLGLGMRSGSGPGSESRKNKKNNNNNSENGSRTVTATDEVSTYLLNAFGSGARLDYGSGHELNFIIWLLCLNRLHLLPQTSPSSSSSSSSSSSANINTNTPTPIFPLIALHIFPHYLRLARLIQSTYYLEPAGSHGVWGLDDHQFLPFLFGAAQLVGHPILTPRSVHNDLLVEEYGAEYLYLDQITYVNSVKTVVKGLRWHSPMLDDISAAKSWAKVEKGMRLMFLNEVLGKVVVMQHFLSGSLVSVGVGVGVGVGDGDGIGSGIGDGIGGCDGDGGCGHGGLERVCAPVMQKDDDGDGENYNYTIETNSKANANSVTTTTTTTLPTSTAAAVVADTDNTSNTDNADGTTGNTHIHSGWGDCCGIRIPSSAGALQEMRKRMGGDRGLRRIPFD